MNDSNNSLPVWKKWDPDPDLICSCLIVNCYKSNQIFPIQQHNLRTSFAVGEQLRHAHKFL